MPLSNIEDRLRELAFSLMLNFAACSLKLKNYDEAGEICSAVLEFDASNVKALYRRALALMGLNLFEEAWGDLTKAANAEPHNKDIWRERGELRVVSGFLRVVVTKVVVAQEKENWMLTSLCCVRKIWCSQVGLWTNPSLGNKLSKGLSNGLDTSLNPPIMEGSGNVFSSLSHKGMECEVDGSTLLKVTEISSSPLRPNKNLQFCNRRRKDNLLSLSPKVYDKILKGEKVSFFHPSQKCHLTVRIHHPSNAEADTSLSDSIPFSVSNSRGDEVKSVGEDCGSSSTTLNNKDGVCEGMESDHLEVMSPQQIATECETLPVKMNWSDGKPAPVDDPFRFSSLPRICYRLSRSSSGDGRCPSISVVREHIPVMSRAHQRRAKVLISQVKLLLHGCKRKRMSNSTSDLRSGGPRLPSLANSCLSIFNPYFKKLKCACNRLASLSFSVCGFQSSGARYKSSYLCLYDKGGESFVFF